LSLWSPEALAVDWVPVGVVTVGALHGLHDGARLRPRPCAGCTGWPDRAPRGVRRAMDAAQQT
jgi:hypothetical protein